MKSYSEKFEEFKKLKPESNLLECEFQFEALFDGEFENSTSDILSWYWDQVRSSTMKIEQISLLACKNWQFDDHSIKHSSGDFFSVEGYHVTNSMTREVNIGWDQPLIKQRGFDGGVIGLVRKRFGEIPHYLLEAKQEPGNYNIVQISPTIQATNANINRAHKGKVPLFSNLFTQKTPGVIVVYDNWVSEDGGRLLNKRNRAMIVDVDDSFPSSPPNERFLWASMSQMKHLIRTQNAIVGCHIRSIISAF